MNFDAALTDDDTNSGEDWILRLGFLIHDCARLRRIVIDEKFKPLNITRSQAWLMAYLSRTEGQPQSALAEQMGLGKVALGGLVDRLQANKMIERRADPADRRINNLFLTAKGKRVVKEMRQLTLEANVDILRGISVAEVKAAGEVLIKLKHNLQDMKSTFEK
ncbi:MAG: MarR family transcriptional regulator [Gammaproteobacteria bacterium]|nr:MarR family transcriptional regulator [Gammaproteobacteria bacterium]